VRDVQAAQKSTVSGIFSRVLMGAGVLLLAGGGLSAYPYVASRLAPVPQQPTNVPSGAIQFEAVVTVSPVVHLSASSTPHSLADAVPSSAAGTATAERTPALPSTPTPTQSPTPAVPSRIVIPTLRVDAPVVAVALVTTQSDGETQSTWEVPAQYAAGWHRTSSPLGVVGNTVLNGHNTTHGEVFRDLYTLTLGDTITLYANDVPYTYTVSETLILPEAGQPQEVRLKNARYILPTTDERVTLVTCHPYGSLRNRLIVIAFPVKAR